jgi:hypothetical protein
MKYTGLMLVAVLACIGCTKKEDAPTAAAPHVAGSWAGTGTDDAIGFYNISLTLGQSGSSASGTFTTTSAFVTQSGNAYLTVGPQGGNNLQGLTLNRVQWTIPPVAGRICAGSMVLSQPTFITATTLAFHYTVTDCAGGQWNGGATLQKTAGTN